MPSCAHDALVELFRPRPRIAVALLSDSLRFAVPRHEQVVVSSIDLTEVLPAERRADIVLLVQTVDQPVLGWWLEEQLSGDTNKRWDWPAYLISLRNRAAAAVVLLVVSPDPAVAAWAPPPIETGHPGWVLRPLVLGPGSYQWQNDPACQHPELVVLSVIAYGEQSHAARGNLRAIAVRS